MATQVPIPKLGQSEETVSIVKWHKQEGDQVAKGDILFEVETDKAVLEVESQFEGSLLKIVVPEGKEVPVMAIAAVIGEPGEKIPEIKAAPEPAGEPPKKTPPPPATGKPSAAAKPPVKSAEPQPEPPTSAAPPKTEASAPARFKISPRAKKIAGEYLIEPRQVTGSGPGGRVVERDVRAYLKEIEYDRIAITPAARNLAARHKLSIVGLRGGGTAGRITIDDVRRALAEQPRPMSKMRQTIARRLQQSKQTIPHFYVTVAVDMSELSAYRKLLKEQRFALSFNDFILRASALSLREFPAVNSVVEDQVKVRRHSRVNLGMAVNVEQGLVVPVVRDADRITLDELHDDARRLANLARDQKLKPGDMQGGTFTVSNMGMASVENFSAIINPGESAILAVSSIQPQAVVLANREIAVRDMMKITVSADHRVVDGMTAARFVNAIKNRLQNISLWERETGIPRETTRE